MSDSPSKSDSRLKTMLVTAALCATLGGMHWLFGFGARRGATPELAEISTYMLYGWVVSGIIAIAFRCSSYAIILLISQAMAAACLLFDMDFADPNGHHIVGISCVGMIAGLITAVGHTIVQKLAKWGWKETDATPTPPFP